MKLRIRSISGAAAGVSLTAAVLSTASGAIAGVDVLYLAVLFPVTFALMFFTARLVFNRFVAFRIKPIYQILLSKNVKTRELTRQGDLVENIRSELNNWAEKNDREIARLKENERYRKEFLGNVSHEIKTPIFTIQGYILTLLDGGMEDETVNRKYLERTEKSIDRMINIVQDLEEISKLESGVLILDRERFCVVALAREIAEAMEMEAARREISIRIGVSGQQPVFVFADRKRIGQVLTNLFSNSIKYGNQGGTTKVSFIDMFDKVLIEVKDNGMGIAQEYIPRVFERFFRVDKSRSREQGGTGLGLSIVKHIIEAHGETITLRSTPGEGSTFSFTLSKK